MATQPHQILLSVLLAGSLATAAATAGPWEEFPVLPSPDDQEMPDIQGTLVVWQEYVSQYGDYDIYVADINDLDELLVTSIGDAGDQTNPVVYRDTVVWQDFIAEGDGGDWDIRMAVVSDMNEPEVFAVSNLVGLDEQQPAISGCTVVWEETAGVDFDIYGADVTDPCLPLVFPVAPFGLDQRRPAIDRNTVVWEDNFFGDWDLLGADVWLRDEPAQLTVALFEKDQRNAAVSRGTVVWEDSFFGDWDVYAARVSERGTPDDFAIAETEADERNPDVDGHLIVWQGNRDGNWDIFGYNLVTRRTFRITNDPGDQINPAVSGNTVVWQDNRDGRWNIYAVVLDGPAVVRCGKKLPGDFDGNCRVDFADLALMASAWLECELDQPDLCGPAFDGPGKGKNGGRRPPNTL